MALTDEAKKDKPQIPAGKAKPDSMTMQIKALNQLLQQPGFTAKQPLSENREQQLTVEVNSLMAENRQLAAEIEKVKKELAKYSAYVLKTQAENEVSLKTRQDFENNLSQLQVENDNLKTQLKGAKTLLKIPFLKSKIVYMK